MLLPTTLPLLLALTALANPTPPHIRPPSIPLSHNLASHSRRTHSDPAIRQSWLLSEARNLKRKYRAHLLPAERAVLDAEDLERRAFEEDVRLGKRQDSGGRVQLQDVGYDASYTGQVKVGTPAQSFQMILDTGSSDMWVTASNCVSSTCTGVTKFNTATSSTFNNLATAFDITYGSGDANGTLASDTVSMGGFTIPSQTFALVSSASAGLLDTSYSGLMGLGWQSLASSGATPFWQALAAGGQWGTQAMGCFMRRYRDDLTAAEVETQGGEITLGYLNTTLYTGDINYISFSASAEDYWRIPVSGATVQSSTISITSTTGASPQAAIDTGTTLIGVPSATALRIYQAIPGFKALTGQYQGYYEYPCKTTIKSSLQFGSLSYQIANGDFNLGQFTSDDTMCTGAFYAQDLSSRSPIQWIVGASFLKNVYSVFSYNPTAIGFAALSGGGSTITNGTATIAAGASSTRATGTATSTARSGGERRIGGWAGVGVLGMVGAVVAML